LIKESAKYVGKQRRQNNITMKAKIAALICIGSLMLARADQMIESVQQALKDQGFYYGEITGQMSSDLTAAVRRYQIRSGLQVNGQLNSETLQSLGINSSAAAQPAAKPASPSPVFPKPGDQSPIDTGNMTPAPVQTFPNAPQDQQVYPSNPVAPATSAAGVLARTPFETAPREPFYDPSRRRWRPPPGPPVHGEWVPE